jgi:Tol biopolymer transport system component
MEPGHKLLHFRVVEKIGEGGMGAVWRADDTTLGRQVAIKVLPRELSVDPDRLSRFEREAQLLASLNHPSIAAVYGFHESDGLHFLVMEMVEGEDLARRLARGPIPLIEAVEIALHVAEAVEAAHDNGVIHRDLKPANVELTPKGKIKVLDFGLAKALSPDAASGDPSLSPTMTSAGTIAGMLLGTAAYMSPEQARGRAVDRRADVWAFGCVLYEMLTGRKTFEGETISDILASVLKTDPDWDALPAATPQKLRRLLRRCLDRNPDRRLAHLSAARVVMREVLEGDTEEVEAQAGQPAQAAPASKVSRLLPWAVSALLALVLAVTFWQAVGRGDAEGETLTLVAPFPDGAIVPDEQMGVMALSPDGRTLAIVLATESKKTLYIRNLSSAGLIAVPDTEDVSTPFFSPDSAWIGFFANDKLKKVSVDGGIPITLTDAAGQNRGASWGSDDRIVYVPHYSLPMMVVSGAGGVSSPLTEIALDRGERTHRWPFSVPGEDLVLFTLGMMDSPESYDGARIDAIRPSSGERTTIYEGASRAWYAPTGHLIFARDGFLFAAPFDVETLELEGNPVPLVENVLGVRSSGVVYAALAENGLLAYIAGAQRSRQSRLTLRYLDGRSEQLPAPVAGYVDPRFSPDRSRIAVQIEGAATFDIWSYDLEQQTSTRLTFEGDNTLPNWSPDGKKIAFASVRNDALTAIYTKAADGSGSAELFYSPDHLPGSGGAEPSGWSADGSSMAVEFTDADAGNLMAVFFDDKREQVLVNTPANESGAALSPDGRWIAYASDESGISQVFVRTYPGAGGHWQISNDGGLAPRWSPDGKRLFYRWRRDLWSARIEVGEGRLNASRPELHFDDLPPATIIGDYDVLDSERILFVERVGEDDEPAGVTVVTNWFEELKRRVPD